MTSRDFLTGEDFSTIRERISAGHRQKDIAADFGVSRSYISNISRGIAGKNYIAPDIPKVVNRPFHPGKPRMTAETVAIARDMFASGATVDAVARRFGLSLPGASNIKHRHSWKHVP